MDKLRVILVCGYINSGKDTFSDYIAQSYFFKKYAFADSLKRLASNTFNIPIENYYNRELKEKVYKDTGYSPRDTCLILGKEKREIDKDYWVNYTINEILSEHKKTGQKKFVISDCRFPNEVYKVKDNFLTRVYWIDRFKSSSITDISEQSISKDSDFIDEIVSNKGTLEEFHSEINISLEKFI